MTIPFLGKYSHAHCALRLELGATIPPSIDVHIPVLGTRVTFNVPENYTILTVERIVRSCREVLSAVPEYRSIAAEVDRGAVALAWRRGMKLDWVWLESGSDRAARDWSVLFGLALQVGSLLQFREYINLISLSSRVAFPPSLNCD